ncbi:hypothetical protein B0H13DRAFT_2280258 [Mycena leptocephala]|nr:hypothetical protein B0H13DRAFT_2280258 [Mycena leptocephala]
MAEIGRLLPFDADLGLDLIDEIFSVPESVSKRCSSVQIVTETRTPPHIKHKQEAVSPIQFFSSSRPKLARSLPHPLTGPLVSSAFRYVPFQTMSRCLSCRGKGAAADDDDFDPMKFPAANSAFTARRRAHPPLYVLAPHAGARVPAPAPATRAADGQRRSLRPAAAAARRRGASAGLFGFGAGSAAVRLGAAAGAGVSTHADARFGPGEPIPATATGIYGRGTIERGASSMIPFLYPGLCST